MYVERPTHVVVARVDGVRNGVLCADPRYVFAGNPACRTRKLCTRKRRRCVHASRARRHDVRSFRMPRRRLGIARTFTGDNGICSGLALGLIALIAIPIVDVFFEPNVGLGAALVFTLFGGFKHGFVRQDHFHVLYFATTACAVAAIASIGLTGRWAGRMGTIAVGISVISLFASTQYALHTSILTGLAPQQIAENISFLTHLTGKRDEIAAENDSALAPDRLTPDAIAKFGTAPVDIEPTEASIAIESGLNWSPVPSLQAYVAYDRLIDDLNVASSINREPGFVLFSWDAIDAHYPFGDSPQRMVGLACRYHVDGAPVHTTSCMSLIVLAGPGSDRCKPTSVERSREIHFGDIVPIDHDPHDPTQLITVAIETRYSLLGRLRKIFYRVGYLYVTIFFSDNTTVRYRVVSDISAGMIVEPSPRSQDDALTFFRQVCVLMSMLSPLPPTNQRASSTNFKSFSGADIALLSVLCPQTLTVFFDSASQRSAFFSYMSLMSAVMSYCCRHMG